MIRRLAPLAIVSLAGCVALPIPPRAVAAAPPFAPIEFFTGHTEGRGVLKVVASPRRVVHVIGFGHLNIDGTLTLVQQVEQAGKATRTRTWSLRANGAGGYEAVLSDATGPVMIAVNDAGLHIRFRSKGGLLIEQWLALDPGGRVARNRLVVRKFGIRIATLEEIIRKTD